MPFASGVTRERQVVVSKIGCNSVALEGESSSQLDNAREAELGSDGSGSRIRAGRGIDGGSEARARDAEDVAGLSELGRVERIERLCSELKVMPSRMIKRLLIVMSELLNPGP